MEDITTNRPDIESLDIDPDTTAFACLSDRVSVLIADIVHAVYFFLRWRQSSKSLLWEVLSRMAEALYFDAKQVDFSEALWPALPDARRKEKISRWVGKLKEDMLRSGFQAVWIEPRRTEQKEDGGYKGLPTRYKRGDFWKLFRHVQDEAVECDLFALSIRKRRAKVRAVVAIWLEKHGARPIEVSAKTEEVKPAKPTLPCRCACASCESCAAKPEVKQPRSTPGLIKQRITAAVDALYDAGQAWKDLGLDEREYWRLFNARIGDLETRMSAPAPPRVKMMGGQPK